MDTVTFNVPWHPFQQVQALPVTADRLGAGIKSCRPCGRFDRVAERPIPFLGPEPVMNEQRHTLSGGGLTLQWRCGLSFQNLSDGAVELLAPTAQQRAVGGVLYEGVLED